jgi:hypothetical protein
MQGERRRVRALADDPDALEKALLEGSGLPGPRANVELASALAEVVGDSSNLGAWRVLLFRWASLDEAAAPVNHPRVYLPFVALQALGALHAGSSAAERAEVVAALRAGANDSRWRLREAVAFGLQRIGKHDFELLRAIAVPWVGEGTPLERRAALVALADPPLLEVPEHAAFALALADQVVLSLFASRAPNLGDPGFDVLIKALAFAPSVYVAAAPSEGFATLSRWADLEPLAAKKMVAANLRKARLARHFPEDVASVGERLASSWAE